MDSIYGDLDSGRLVGGLLAPRETIVGAWRPTEEAFAALAAGTTERVVVPTGGTAGVALVAGAGAAEVRVPPAQIVARVTGAHPQQVRYDESWLRRLLLSERLLPTPGGVQWRTTSLGIAEAWVPVRPAVRRSRGRRPVCC